MFSCSRKNDDPRARQREINEHYEAQERRRWAATILDTPELLMMQAEARGDVCTTNLIWLFHLKS